MVAILTASADVAALPACTYLRASLDLRVTLPKECRWGSKAMITRVFGWHFLNGRLKLSWKEFHRKVKERRTKYWQVHHANKDPSHTLSERLQIVTHSRNQREQKHAFASRAPLAAHCAQTFVRVSWNVRARIRL